MSAPPNVSFIDSPESLQMFCEELGTPPWIALDTEFLRERTYFPKFCLLQIATTDRVACIDPLACPDLSALDPLFDHPQVVKVFHSGRQDLEVLCRARAGRLPSPVFDTQIAAPYTGLADQIGYAALAAELVGAQLEKGHTRTDWSARPLSEAQLQYAVDDVLYLGQIYLRLAARLAQLGRRDWVDEETAKLINPALYDPDPQDAWLRIGGSGQLAEREGRLLQTLAAWRERLARTQDCPRSWIAKDEALMEIARQRPKDIAALKRAKGLDERSAKRFGDALLSIVHAASDAAPVSRAPKARPVPETPTQEALLDVFTALLRLKGAECSLNPALIASRRELREFIATPEGSPLLQGWRGALAGQELLAILRGTKSLRIVEGLLRVTDSACA